MDPHSERDLLLRLLAGPVSGDVLARETGLTRSAVWKRVEALRAAGVDIEARPGRGYALAGPLDLLDAGEILAHLPQLNEAAALALADRFRGAEGPAQFSLLFERLSVRVHDQAAERARRGEGGLDRWAAAWETLQRLPREVEALNLDRTDALFAALSDLRAAARA